MNHTQREKLIDRLCATVLMLICFEIFYGVVRSAYTQYNYDLKEVTTWVNISGGIILAISIAVLIYAYIKKNGRKAVYGVELLVLAFSAATLPGSYLEFSYPFNKLNIVFPIAFLIYYIGKGIYIYINAVKVSNSTKKSSKKSSKKKKR